MKGWTAAGREFPECTEGETGNTDREKCGQKGVSPDFSDEHDEVGEIERGQGVREREPV